METRGKQTTKEVEKTILDSGDLFSVIVSHFDLSVFIVGED